MTRAFYISANLTLNSYGGATVGRTNYRIFKELFGENSFAIAVNRNPIDGVLRVQTSAGRVGTAVANLFGLCATLTSQGEREIYERVRRERPSIIWLDSSLFGRLIPRLRIEAPGVKIVCFFHNLEEDIVREKIAKGQWAYYLALVATHANEQMSAKQADTVVMIQKSDAKLLLSRYGRPADHIFPVCVHDSYSEVVPPNPYPGIRYVLFVGSDFPPNIEALEYLSRRIAPSLENTMVIAVGNGLEKYVAEFAHEKMIIEGFVPDLAAIYYHAVAVVAPIFSGGGMKVKIAEALMHNKVVIASDFAAIGYEECAMNSLVTGDGEGFFVDEIQKSRSDGGREPRNDYLEFYSMSSAKKHMRDIFDGVAK